MLGSGVDLASEVGSEQGNQVVHGFRTLLLSSHFTSSSSRRSAVVLIVLRLIALNFTLLRFRITFHLCFYCLFSAN